MIFTADMRRGEAMSDSISRHGVSAWLQCMGYPKLADIVMNEQRFPSEQPEIIRCRDCKHHWIYKCMDSMPSEVCDLDQTFYNSDFDFCSLAERRTDA